MIVVFRALGGIVAGMFVALILIIAVELLCNMFHPFPADFRRTPEEMCAHVARFPQWVLAVAAAAWGLTAFVSTWVAQRIGGVGAGLFIGLLLVAAVVLNLSMLPYPIWFKVVNSIMIPGAVVLACRSPMLKPKLVTA